MVVLHDVLSLQFYNKVIMYGIWVFSMLFVGLQTGLWGAKRVLGRYWEVEEKQNMPRVARLFYPFPILPFYWIDYLSASSLGTGTFCIYLF